MDFQNFRRGNFFSALMYPGLLLENPATIPDGNKGKVSYFRATQVNLACSLVIYLPITWKRTFLH
jgi:hypothetical protein